jgi:hypothetical protein
MMRCNLIALFVLLTGVTVANAADELAVAADNAETDVALVKLSGFGTLGVSHSSQNLGDYVLDSTIPKGAGRSNRWFMGNDSRLGAQATANMTPKTTAVVQVISEYQADNSYRPALEWANVKYAFTPDVYIRAGRIALPTFMNSDSRKVGYSYPWIHPPVDLYRQLAITSSDGFDVMYHSEIGEAGNALKMIYGSNTIDRPTNHSTSKDMWGIFDTLEYGATTVHFGYQKRIAASQNVLTGVTGAWVRNSDLSLGVGYDPGDWFVMSEWMQRRSTTIIDAMYLSAGRRIKQFTPYMTYSQNSQGTFLASVPAPTAAAIQSAKRSQSTVSVGVRWDWMRNADFKLQYDQVRLSDNSNGYLTNLPLNTVLYGTKFHLISAVVDFVF